MRRTALLLVSASIVTTFAVLAYALDPPHDWDTVSVPPNPNQIDCTDCHKMHNAPGGTLTTVAGNANLCQTCHRSGGLALNKPLANTDEAFPSPGLASWSNVRGTSHRWDSGASGHVKPDDVTPNQATGTVQSGGAFTGRYSKTYTLTITTSGNVGTAYFAWTATTPPGGSGSSTVIPTSATPGVSAAMSLDEGITVTFTDGASPAACGFSFCADDKWRVYVRTDINQPGTAAMATRLSGGKVTCSTCHDQHSQAVDPFDPSAPVYGGAGTGAGRHFQRSANDTGQMCLDCHSARNRGSLSGQTGNLTHPVGLARSIWNGLFKARASITLPLDKGADGVAGNTDDRIQCLSCHQPHYAATTDGTLQRLANATALCTDCHTLADTASGTHFDSSTGVLWPGGQYGSDFPAITDATKRGSCTNCHQPHGWPDSGNPTQDYPKLLVETTGNLCFTCHDADGPSTRNVYDKFNPSPNYSTTGASGAPIDQVHDSTLCSKCHNPHQVKASGKNTDPDTGEAYMQTYSPANAYTRGGFNQSYRSASTDLDPTFSGGTTWTVGAAACQGSCADTATSGGTYAPQGDEGALTQIVYTVTVSTGGTPGGPPTYSIATPVCTNGAGGTCSGSTSQDDTATSGGSYDPGADTGNISYWVTVTTAGGNGSAAVTTTSTSNRDNSGPATWTSGVALSVGTRGVQITVSDTAGAKNLALNQQWRIDVTQTSPGGEAKITIASTNNLDNEGPKNVTAFDAFISIGTRGLQVRFTDGGDGVLTQNDTWNIPVDKSTAPPEPDMVTFCLTCHDGTPPAGVTMPSNMVNIAGTYFASGNQHGSVAGNTGTSISKGYKKVPWTSEAQFNAGREPDYPYAALQCTTCHDGHGSDNIFHLKESITVAGTSMKVGGEGQCANGTNCGPWTVANGFTKSGNTTYKLPCTGGNGNPDCSQNPTGSQAYLYWGAWCSFCHTQSAHTGVAETTSCNTAHKHGGNNF